MTESTTASNSMDYLDDGANSTSYVTPHSITNDSYFTSDGSTVLELQSSISQFIDASTVENPSTSDESFVSSSSTSSSTTNYLETISISLFDVIFSTISELLPEGSSATKSFPAFHSSPSNDSNTESEPSYPQTEVSRRTAFETAVFSSTTLLFTNGTSNISTAPETTSSISTEPDLSTTQERQSSSTLATKMDSANKTKLPTKVSSISQWNTQTQTTAFQRTDFTANNSITELPSKSDHFDGQRLAAALGTLAVILVLAIVIILLALWWRSRKQKLRMTLLKLRSISQQTRTSAEDPPDICLDVSSFALSQVFPETDVKHGKPDVASHVFRRMLSAHEDALNFSREDARDRPISMVQLGSHYGSSDHYSQIQDNRRIQSTHDLTTCQSSFSEGGLGMIINNLDSSSAV